MSRWNLVTETAVNLPNDAIPFTMTPHLKDAAAMCRVEIEAMRRHRDPDGLTVTEATHADWLAAKDSFRAVL